MRGTTHCSEESPWLAATSHQMIVSWPEKRITKPGIGRVFLYRIVTFVKWMLRVYFFQTKTLEEDVISYRYLEKTVLSRDRIITSVWHPSRATRTKERHCQKGRHLLEETNAMDTENSSYVYVPPIGYPLLKDQWAERIWRVSIKSSLIQGVPQPALDDIESSITDTPEACGILSELPDCEPCIWETGEQVDPYQLLRIYVKRLSSEFPIENLGPTLGTYLQVRSSLSKASDTWWAFHETGCRKKHPWQLARRPS